MKRRDIIKKIADEAKRQDLEWKWDREGANHTVYKLDGLMIPIGHHREIDNPLAEKIFRECEPKLGKGWWR